jgi:transposase
MKGYSVYSRIQQLKEKGFKKAAVAKQLGINRRTVNRYWNMAADDYEENSANICRAKALSEYEAGILKWLQSYPTISAAQICDWLKEYYSVGFSERTVSRYVKELREAYQIKKVANPREYEAVAELPMGQQMQVDFGEKWMKDYDGNRVKVYVAAFVLACSRYKYAEVQMKPFRATDLVAACHRCFRYIGGMPSEMVFDQDSILCVSENNGDIIHTYEFEKLRQECKFSVYLCRGADPESKGKIESVVKYVKGNFLENRIYVDDSILNYCMLDWLERTANAKVHGTTKRVPAEVFKEEREHLRPLIHIPENKDAFICRTVRKDNTIVYESNRYSVPLGTYSTNPEVRIEVQAGVLSIQTVFGDPICEHRISTGKGMLIQNNNHLRDRTSSLNRMQKDLDELMNGKASDFLQAIRTEKSRYARDQFKLIRTLCDKYALEAVLQSIDFCRSSRLYSANYMKDYLEHSSAPLTTGNNLSAIPVSNKKYHITTEKRPLEVYAKVGAGR